jgi:hypothetical protein
VVILLDGGKALVAALVVDRRGAACTRPRRR